MSITNSGTSQRRKSEEKLAGQSAAVRKAGMADVQVGLFSGDLTLRKSLSHL
jgi:hypothetical protein